VSKQSFSAEDSSGTESIEGATSAPSSGPSPYPPSRYAWWVVAVLMVVYIFSFIDRQILNLLVTPIKADLGISDSQMSYLMGFSFAILYTVMGLPFGRLADMTNRKRLIAAGLGVWSFMTAGCGVARSYLQFLFLRVGVGVGEATLSPSAYSLITDLFPKQKLGRALSLYSMGIYIGAGMALILGGGVTAWATAQGKVSLPVVGVIHPWQVVFLIVGAGGMLPLLLLLTIREPVRRGVRRITAEDGSTVVAKVPIREVLAFLGKNWKTVICHHVGFAILSFSSYGIGAWHPAFLERTHGWDMGRIGLLTGGYCIVTGSLGILAGGWLTDWLGRRGHTDATMRVGLMASIAWVIPGIFYPLVPNAWVAYTLMAIAYFFVSFPIGAAAAAIQNIMPNAMRGQASALYLFAVNLLGLGLGPSAVAWCTDYLFRDEMMVRYSIVIVGVGAHVIAVFAFWLGLKPYRESVERLKRWLAEDEQKT
jgi:MFS family permease